MKELLSLRMDKREKVQDFNQIFSTHLSNFCATTKPTKDTLVEYYTQAFCPNITIFVKRAVKCTLVENYEESNKVEAELDSINKHTIEPEVKSFSGKKPMLLTRPKEEH